MANGSNQTPRFPDQASCRAIRDVFAQADFTDAGILSLLRDLNIPSLIGQDLTHVAATHWGYSLLECLVRLFLMEQPVGVEIMEKVLAPVPIGMWVESGLLRIEADEARANVCIIPYHDILLAFDTKQSLRLGREDFVMGIGRSSLTLANLTVRTPSRNTLDLGAGGGIQAFLAAGHSQHVLAVDRNVRAVQFANFNAQLNGFDHVEARAGDLFEPAEGRTFDLIVTNPPFVISPESQYIYRDSGYKGDEVGQAIIRQIPRFLNEGGYCLMLCNWAHLEGQNWHERLLGWFADRGCDVLVLRSETSDPRTYATTWIKHTEHSDPQHFDERLSRWVEYYQRQGIEAISAGVIVLRRTSSGLNWTVFENTPEKMLGPCGHEIVRRFEAQDFLNTVSDDAVLLETQFRLAPETQLLYRCKPDDDEGWSVVGLELTRSAGFVYHDALDVAMAQLLGRCTGQHRVSQLVGDLAVGLGQDGDVLAQQICPLLRGLVQRGYLLPLR